MSYIPHSPESEKVFVGTILISEGRLLDQLPPVDLDLFYLPAVQVVMETMQSRYLAGQPSDLVSLTGYMNERVQATCRPVEGWQKLLNELQLRYGGVGEQACLYHLSILREQLQLRRLLALQTWLGGQIRPGSEVADIMQGIGERLATIEPAADVDDHALPGAVKRCLAALDEWNAGSKPAIITTPITVWNTAFGGLPTGGYLALGGRPGAGKSAMAEQIIFSMIEQEEPVLLFQKDMSVDMFTMRLACRAAGVPYWKIGKGFASREERDAVGGCLEYFPKTSLRLHDPSHLTAEKVAAIVRREKRQFGIKAVFLDHIQLLRYKGESRTEGLTEASITLKNSAHDSGVCHVVLFQLNRQGAKKHTDGTSVRPSAADVKDFDQLLSDVDGMAMLWSEQDKTSLGKGERLEVNFYSAKNRSGGETEEPVYFDGPYISFVNSPQDHVPTFKQPAPSIPYPYDK